MPSGLGTPPMPRFFLRQETGHSDAVRLRDFVFESAATVRDLFLLRPGALVERIVAADSKNVSIRLVFTRSNAWLTSHISFVQPPVKAIGKNRRTVFFLPPLLLKPDLLRALCDFVVSSKSGGLSPTFQCHCALLII